MWFLYSFYCNFSSTSLLSILFVLYIFKAMPRCIGLCPAKSLRQKTFHFRLQLKICTSSVKQIRGSNRFFLFPSSSTTTLYTPHEAFLATLGLVRFSRSSYLILSVYKELNFFIVNDGRINLKKTWKAMGVERVLFCCSKKV